MFRVVLGWWDSNVKLGLGELQASLSTNGFVSVTGISGWRIEPPSPQCQSWINKHWLWRLVPPYPQVNIGTLTVDINIITTYNYYVSTLLLAYHCYWHEHTVIYNTTMPINITTAILRIQITLHIHMSTCTQTWLLLLLLWHYYCYHSTVIT